MNCPSCHSDNTRIDGHLTCDDCGKSFTVSQGYYGQCSGCGESVRFVPTDGNQKFSYECHTCGKSETWDMVDDG